MNITKEQWEGIVSGILEFNRLVTTKEERSSEQYIIKCYNLVEEELKEYRDSGENTLDELDAICDVTVTVLQLIDSITPSLLSYEYFSKVWSEPVWWDNCNALVGANHFMSLVVGVIRRAEYLGHNFYGAMLAINASNLSKIPFVRNNFDAVTCCKEIEEKSNGRYTGVHTDLVFDKEHNMRLVFKDSNKKVMKPIGAYQEPILTPYMNRGE